MRTAKGFADLPSRKLVDVWTAISVNIVLINHYAGSLRHGMEYRPFFMAREWVRAGHSVTIVAASHAHSRSRDPHTEAGLSREVLDGIQYLWLRTPSYRGNGARRVANMLTFVAQVMRYTRWIVRACRPDIVIASSTYPLDIVPAYRIAKCAAATLMFEVHDLWPLSPMLLSGMSAKHPFIVLLQWAEDFAYREADWVVSMLPNAKPYMVSRGMSPEKYLYVPNGVDLSEWESSPSELPAEHAKLIASLRGKGRFLIGYAGAHGLANALDSVVRAGEALASTAVSLVLVGDGPEKPSLQQLAKSLGLAEVHFLPSVPRRTVPALIGSMDAMIISLKRSPLFQFGVSPNKLMDYMIAEKPVIQAIDASSDIVGDCGCGLSVPGENPSAIANAAMTLMAIGPDRLAAMGRLGKQYVTARHDYRVLAREFLKPVLS